MGSIKGAKYASLLYSAVFIVLGICLLFRPEWSAIFICRLMGAASVLCGVIRMISYFIHDTYGLAFQFDLALGAFTALVGLFLLLYPKGLLSVVSAVIGIFVMVDGTFKLQTAIEARRFGLRRWWGILLCALLAMAAGLVLLLWPFQSSLWLTCFLGISLIAEGIQNLCVAAYTVRLIKRFDPIGEQEDDWNI